MFGGEGQVGGGMGSNNMRSLDPSLPAAPGWRDYDKELSKLLEEIPRATSAPPHLQDRWAMTPAPDSGFGAGSGVSRATPVGQSVADIRYDEDYARFYDLYSGQRKLPPPAGHTLYQELLLQRAAVAQPQMAAGHGMLSRSGTGLEVIDEQGGIVQGVQSMPGMQQGMNGMTGMADSMLQAFQQLAVRGNSPMPNHMPSGVANGMSPVGSKPGTPMPYDALLNPGQQLPQAGGGGVGGMAGPGPAGGMPPMGMGMPGAAAGLPPLPVPSPLEYQVAYQAAYHAALLQTQQQQAAALGLPPMPGLAGLDTNAVQLAAATAVAQQLASMAGAAAVAGGAAGFYPGMGPAGAHLGAAAAAAAAAAAVSANYLQHQGGSDDGRGRLHDRYGGAGQQGMGMGMGGGGMGGRHDRMGNGMGPQDRRGGAGRRDRDGNGFHGSHQHNLHLQHQQQMMGLGGGGGGGSGGGMGPDDGLAFKFQTLDEVVGQVMSVARDQNGCRFLQRKFDEGGAAAVAVVFPEVLAHLVELMTDPFGNYLIQKLLDRCSEQQRSDVLKEVAARGVLVTVALNMHGTRAVQKLVETLSSREQKTVLVEALGGGVVQLIKDLNGNHVVQRCLQRLGPVDSQFIYDAACSHTLEVATHRHGCCVLQRCIDHATPPQRDVLVQRIAEAALPLSQDAFGNYVVQYVLELGLPEASAAVIRQLQGHLAELSLQKFSSNVVEKCLKLSGVDAEKEAVVREIMLSPLLPRVLQDAYGNYVVQSILGVQLGGGGGGGGLGQNGMDGVGLSSTAALHQLAVEAIRPHIGILKTTPHGKRILQRIGGKA